MKKRIKNKLNKQNTIKFLIEMVGNNTDHQFYVQDQIRVMSNEIKRLQNQINDLNEFTSIQFESYTEYQKYKKMLLESELN